MCVCVCHAPLDVEKSCGQAATKLVTCGFSEWKSAIECFVSHMPTDNQINKKQEEAELNRKSLVSVTETIYAHTRACVIVCVCVYVYIYVYAEDKECRYVLTHTSDDFAYRWSSVKE